MDLSVAIPGQIYQYSIDIPGHLNVGVRPACDRPWPQVISKHPLQWKLDTETTQRSNNQIQKQMLPPFQIIKHPKNLGESINLKFDQDYREKYKNL